MDFDRLDIRILEELQRDGRLTTVELAKRVNLSPTPCANRVRKLEQAGVILGYRAQLDPAKLGLGLLLFVEVSLTHTTEDVLKRFRAAVAALPEIEECHMVGGGFDYLLKVRVRDMAAYRHFMGAGLSRLPEVSGTHSYFVMEETKTGGALPLTAAPLASAAKGA